MAVFKQIMGEVKMPRLQYLEVNELDPNDRDLLKLALNLYRKLVNSPDRERTFYTAII